MKNIHRFLLLIIIGSFFPLRSIGKDFLKVLDNMNGLPDNTVNCIRQDARGFLWMGTANGLCRYDGLQFSTFVHKPNDVFSLTNDYVHKVLPAPKGIWVTTDGGMQFYSFSDDNFHMCYATDGRSRYLMKMRINSLVSSGGNIFAADESGNFYINKGGSAYEQFTVIKHNFRIYALCKYTNSMLLAVSDKGLYLLAADGRRIVSHYPCNINISFNTNVYYSHNSKLVYVGGGIGFQGLAFRITGNKIGLSDAYVPSNLMDVTDYQHATVFATDGNGIVIGNGNASSVLKPSNTNLSGDAIYSLFTDRSDNLWIGTYRAGVNMSSKSKQWFTALNKASASLTYDIVTAVLPGGDKIYVGTDGGGLNIYNRAAHSTRSFNTGNSRIAGNNIVSMTKDNDYLWMAIYTKGLGRMSLRNSSFSIFPMPKVNGIAGNTVWAICDDGLGNIWIGGPNLVILNKKTERLAVIPGLSGIYCSAIQCRGDYVWISANHKGIYKVNKYTHKIAAHFTTDSPGIKLPSNDVKYMRVDSHDNIWFTSPYSGFYSMNEHTRKIHSYGISDRLTNTNVVAISEDNQDRLWMCTTNGLFRFDPRTRTFLRFDEDEHIPSTFTYGSTFFDGQTMYLGSTRGLIYFNPSKIRYQQLYSGVSFTSLELLNKDHCVFNLYGDHPKHIRLDYDQNFFTINFSVPEMNSPNRVHFSCYLKGLEQGWRELGRNRQTQYTNLPPGKYEFCVRCTDSNGQWGRPSVLGITVTPPWYATWWARIIWFTLFLSMAVAAFLFYLHELDVKHRVQIMEVRNSTMKRLNEAKMNFYTRVTHELRTPIFLIAAQIEELIERKTTPVQVPQSYLYSMFRNSQKLNRLISRVIDFRKMDADTMALNLQHRNVVEFCENLCEDYKSLCEQKNIAFSFHYSKTNIQLYFDLDKLETILTNLVSNAFKYTKEGGVVMLSVKECEDAVSFSVKDNGIGIIENMRNAIFQSFTRTEQAEAQSSGDGVGLSTVKSLIELHGGTISVDSEVNIGSCFTFRIPKNLQSKDHIDDIDAVRTPPQSGTLPVIQPKLKQETVYPRNPAATHSILVIDDEHDTVDLLERNLVSDFKVFKAYDGEQGLTVARAELPDIIICDLMMPNMDGMQLLRTLKNDKTLQHIKVIIFTAKTSEDDMIQAYDNSADAYLTKPVSLKYLRMRIDRMVAQADSAIVTASISKEKKTYNKEEQIFLLRCREIIDDNLRNEDFSIYMLADHLAMSHSSLYKKIKAMTGMSLIEFINDYKIYRAVQMFREGASNIDSVCEQCGFNDSKNFRQMFRRKMNVTPKQYVQSL